MRTRWVLFLAAAMLAGAIGGTLVAPVPVSAVAREIIELQRDVTLLLQGQRDLQSSLEQKHAVVKTLLEQSSDSVNKLSSTMGSMQKAMQDVQANSGTRLDTMATQVQGLADNLEEVKARLAKLNQQLADMQGTMQSLDSKISGGTPAANPAPGGGSGGPGPAPSADVLYSNGLRDFTGGKYDLARQEFLDYLRYYPNTDLASNAQFYLGEIYYAQRQYKEAIGEYDKVITNFPKSFKLATAHFKKGMALQELGQKASAIREYREVVQRFPGTDEERRARAKLRELGATSSTR
ncbi:MAG TPA: tol-pal system protein YbgF [Candidatus Acidoferrales bacterium]|nr:tol-pal system protein YbgF [Candidatus Acidoferrales bacterium]